MPELQILEPDLVAAGQRLQRPFVDGENLVVRGQFAVLLVLYIAQPVTNRVLVSQDVLLKWNVLVVLELCARSSRNRKLEIRFQALSRFYR